MSDTDLQHFWPMIRKAAGYLVANGPVTEQDRWEENAGFSTFTLAVEISALLIAADYAEFNNEPQLAEYLRETADSWNSCIERWTYVTGSDLAKFVGVDGYYVRISSKESVDPDNTEGNLLTISNRPAGENICPAHEMVSPDALALVRYGLRKADDPKILNTIKVIDATLKLENTLGPLWYRYNRDGYGEHSDGTPFNGTGIGRPWPLLTGERAHYEIAAGNYNQAETLMKTMENYANETGLFAEQIWDSENIPQYGLYLGKPSGGAMPLVWAHSEYIKLCRSLGNKAIFDMPLQTKERYLVNKKTSNMIIWGFNNKYKYIPKGSLLRIQCLASAIVRWSFDGWATQHDVQTLDSGVGTHYTDIKTEQLDHGHKIEYTFYWNEAKVWENQSYSVSVEKDPALKAENDHKKNQAERDKIRVFLPS
jgi:glucoamylase